MEEVKYLFTNFASFANFFWLHLKSPAKRTNFISHIHVWCHEWHYSHQIFVHENSVYILLVDLYHRRENELGGLCILT